MEIQAELSALSESLCDLESGCSQSTFDMSRIRLWGAMDPDVLYNKQVRSVADSFIMCI